MRFPFLSPLFAAAVLFGWPLICQGQIELIETHAARHSVAYSVEWSHESTPQLLSGGIDGKFVMGNSPGTQISHTADILSPMTLASQRDLILVAGFDDRPKVFRHGFLPESLPNVPQCSLGLVFDEANKLIATAGEKEFKVWKWTGTEYEIVDFGPLGEPATSMTWAKSGLLAIGDGTGTIHLRDTVAAIWKPAIELPANNAITALHPLPAGQEGLFSGDAKGNLVTWKLPGKVETVTLEDIQEFGLSQQDNAIVWCEGEQLWWSYLEEFEPKDLGDCSGEGAKLWIEPDNGDGRAILVANNEITVVGLKEPSQRRVVAVPAEELPAEENGFQSVSLDEKAEILLFATSGQVFAADLTVSGDPITPQSIVTVGSPDKPTIVQCLPRHKAVPNAVYGMVIHDGDVTVWNLTAGEEAAKLGELSGLADGIVDLKFIAIEGNKPSYLGVLQKENSPLQLLEFLIDEGITASQPAESTISVEDGWKIHDYSLSRDLKQAVLQLVPVEDMPDSFQYKLTRYSILPLNSTVDEQPLEEELESENEPAPWQTIAQDSLLREGHVARAIRLLNNEAQPPIVVILEDQLKKTHFLYLAKQSIVGAVGHLALSRAVPPKLLVASQVKDFSVFPADLSGGVEQNVVTDNPISAWAVASQTDTLIAALDTEIMLWRSSDFSAPAEKGELEGRVSAIALSPDDRKTYLGMQGDEDPANYVKIVNTPDLRELQQFTTKDLDRIVGIVPFLDSDSTKVERVVTATDEGIVQDWRENLELSFLLGPQNGATYSGEIAKDGQAIVTGSADGFVCVWSTNVPGQADLLYSLDPKEWGKAFERKLEDELTDAELAEKSDVGRIYGVAIDATSTVPRFLAVNQSGLLIAWTPEDVLTTIAVAVSKGPLYRTCLQPDGDLVAIGAGISEGETTDAMRVVLYKKSDLEIADTQPADWLSSSVYGLKFSPDGELLAAVDIQGRIAVWDIDNLAMDVLTANLPDTVRAHALAWHPIRKNTFAVAGSNGSIYVFQVNR